MTAPKNVDATQSVACTACAASIEGAPVERCTEPVFRRSFELYACRNCGVIFTQPQNDFPLQQWYSKASYLYGELEYSVRAPAARDWRFKKFRRTAEQYGLRGRLLDVGCGDGRFLIQQNRWGWDGGLKGLDFTPEMTRRSESGCEIEVASLRDFVSRSAAAPFDVVTLFDVLEHFPRPADALNDVRRLIKIGGYLIVTTPNGERLRFFGREEYDFPPNHFTRWNSASLSGLIRRSGFEIERAAVSGFGPRMISEQIFYPLFWRLMPWVKRILFGRQAASSGKTLTELLQEKPEACASGSKDAGGIQGLIRSKAARKRIENVLRNGFNIAAFPILIPVCLVLSLLRPRSGAHLFVMARRTN